MLSVAIPCALAAAAAYGASTAVQHSAAHTGSGEEDIHGLLNLLTNPRWLLSIGGDTVGLVLQVVALATGPVVLIQPLLVLAVPISLPVGRLLGGPRPGRGDYLASIGILAGLAGFFAIVGDPGEGRTPSTAPVIVAVIVSIAVGALGCAAASRGRAALRAGVYGAIAGAGFGVVGVLLNAVSNAWRDHGFDGVSSGAGVFSLIGLALVGACAMVLTQISFQVGVLSASFPANESAAPLAAVLLGALLLHERIPVSAGAVIGYVATYAVVVAGTIYLAGAAGRAKAVDVDTAALSLREGEIDDQHDRLGG
ncbi:MAG: DMT family transporter [Actinobacteria bacterium]|nr:DMT family transporter [Actinomycetota bacterium]